MAADVSIRIGADLAEIKGALASLSRDLQQVGQRAQEAGRAGAFGGIQSGANAAVGAVGKLAAAFGGLYAVMRAIGAADELNTLNARLKIATATAEEYNRAQQALFDLAQRTRAGLGDTVDLYSRIALATKEAGIGQETLLEVVQTINQAVQLSGVSASAAQAALIQLGQGLASGTLRGEELNSILEQTPALADAIAKGMGITRGELRLYGQQGKITGQAVIEALQAQRKAVADQFAQLPLTVGQSVTLARNAGVQLLGAFDAAFGATTALSSAIRGLSDLLSSTALTDAVTAFAAAWGDALSGLASDAREAASIVSDALSGIADGAGGAAGFIAGAFRDLPANIRAAIKIATIEIAAFVDSTRESFAGIGSYIRAVVDPRRTVAETREALRASQAAIEQARRDSIDAALAERDQSIGAAGTATARARAAREAGRRDTGRRGTGRVSATGGSNTPAADKAAKEAEQVRKAQLDAEQRLAEDASKRELDVLKEQFDAGTLAARDYYARRQALELASLDASIATERERARAGGAEGVKALAEVELLERRKLDVQRNAATEQAAFLSNIEQQRAQASAAAGNNPVETARARAEAQYRDLLTRLRAEGDEAGVAIIEKLINTEVADARLQELQGKVQSALGNMRAQEALVAAQADAGLLPQLEAQRQLATLREQGVTQLRAYRDALIEVAQAQTAQGGIADPRVAEQIVVLNTEIARATASQQRLVNDVQNAGANALSGFFLNLASGAKGFGDAVRDAATQFLQSLARMAADALAKRTILSLVGAFGGPAAAGGGLLAGVLHSGGPAGGGARRMVSPLLFVGAPRFHGGGMVGLRPDERPAILQTGERVLSRNEAGGSGAGSGTRVVNVFDPGFVPDQLDSADGERVIMNIIGRNPGRVRQLLG